MVTGELEGFVVLVAGDDPALTEVGGFLIGCGAFVAFVSQRRRLESAQVSFAADPADPAVWERAVPHVEQRLGPIDGVVTDTSIAAVVEPYVADTFAQRHRGPVVQFAGDIAAALTQLRATLRAEPN
ncbi:MAG: hypothetical protein JO222_04075 [Frankiales bacterium]|nr:hypothetical protein [Frankiales bacterium]